MVEFFKPDTGWSWVILVASVCSSLIFDGITYSSGVFFVEFLEEFQESHSKTAWTGSTIPAMYALIGPLVGFLVNRFGCRLVTILGSLVAAIGFIVASFSHNLLMLIFTYGVMVGVGFGFMHLCSHVIVGFYFDKHRALAIGITSCGSGIGTFVLAPLSSVLIDFYSWRGALWILSGIILNGVVVGAVYRPIPKENVDNSSRKEKTSFLNYHLMSNPVLLILCFASFFCMIGFFMPFIYLPDFAQHNGLSVKQGAYLISIIGITNTTGRVLFGFIADRPWADPLKMRSAALIIGGITTMLCSHMTSFSSLCIFAAIFGFCIASYVSLTTVILVQFLGLEQLSSSLGYLSAFRGLGLFVGAPLGGVFIDDHQHYAVPFYMAGAAILLAGVVTIPLKCILKLGCSQRCVSTRNDVDECLKTEEDAVNVISTKDHMAFHESSVGKHTEHINPAFCDTAL